ncbi:hypothetical protein RJT34_05166 [Clitoria ternatea]|uniref:Uncharacterized protein n=1 Tax=Clitoria ternatea TaxID=43366 RepID=A0AAN9K2S5_CLITE
MEKGVWEGQREERERILVVLRGNPRMRGSRRKRHRHCDSTAEEKALQHFSDATSVRLFGGSDTYDRHPENDVTSSLHFSAVTTLVIVVVTNITATTETNH